MIGHIEAQMIEVDLLTTDDIMSGRKGLVNLTNLDIYLPVVISYKWSHELTIVSQTGILRMSSRFLGHYKICLRYMYNQCLTK